jgi:hypothetical protein
MQVIQAPRIGDGRTIGVSGAGVISVLPEGIDTQDLADGAATAAKVAPDVATQAELDAHAAASKDAAHPGTLTLAGLEPGIGLTRITTGRSAGTAVSSSPRYGGHSSAVESSLNQSGYTADPVWIPCRLVGIYCRVSAAASGGAVLEVLKNGNATGILVNIPAGQTGLFRAAYPEAPVSFAAGDTWGFRVTQVGGITLTEWGTLGVLS